MSCCNSHVTSEQHVHKYMEMREGTGMDTYKVVWSKSSASLQVLALVREDVEVTSQNILRFVLKRSNIYTLSSLRMMKKSMLCSATPNRNLAKQVPS